VAKKKKSNSSFLSCDMKVNVSRSITSPPTTAAIATLATCTLAAARALHVAHTTSLQSYV